MTQAPFLSWHPITLAVVLTLAGCAPANTVRFESTARYRSQMLTARLYRAEGSGRFPAVVLLHGCAGIRPHIFSWARWLSDEGYVALVVDSFSAPDRSRDVCATQRNPSVSEVARDAFGALAYLRSQPFVEGDRIAVMGFSYGGMAAFAAGNAHESPMFRASVAFYPDCRHVIALVTIPVLLLLGGADTETPPALCIENGQLLQSIGRPVSWKVYPQATHAFDHADIGSRTTSKGFRFDATATADAEKEVRAFLARHLR